MNKVKGAFNRFWTRARGFVRRRSGEGRDEKSKDPNDKGKRPKDPSSVPALRLVPLAFALSASVVVFAILTQCEYWAYDIPLFRSSWCGPLSQTFRRMSTSGGVGFVIFLTAEVVAMIFAQMWKDRQIDRAERREEAAERRAEFAEQARREDADRAERRAEAAERRAELAEQARREDADRAERRELLLIELIESLKNGSDAANGKNDSSE